MPAINLHQPSRVLFVTKYNGMRWVEGFHGFAGLMRKGGPAFYVSEIAGRFRSSEADAYRLLNRFPGKVLILFAR